LDIRKPEANRAGGTIPLERKQQNLEAGYLIWSVLIEQTSKGLDDRNASVGLYYPLLANAKPRRDHLFRTRTLVAGVTLGYPGLGGWQCYASTREAWIATNKFAG
jgi:hypothetical protein